MERILEHVAALRDQRQYESAVAELARALRETDGMTEAEALAHEWEYGQAVFRTNDGKEGPLAFAEKRKPKYTRT